MTHFFDVNLRNWNDRAAIHVKDEAGGYGVKAFLDGADTLHDIEHGEIGDVRGKRIVHLQCHFGMDTLSLARRGASCVGLDFAPVAIAAARDLQQKTGLDARFVEGNVHDARSLIEGEFDMAYVTWGAINWLPDMFRWAAVVSSMLKPGGMLYLLEGHPFPLMLDETTPEMRPAYGWRTPADKPVTMDTPTTYTGDAAIIANPTTHEWLHPLSDIINGLIRAGMRIDTFNEHEKLAWQFSPIMVPVEGRRRMWILPVGFPKLPLSFSIKAVKV